MSKQGPKTVDDGSAPAIEHAAAGVVLVPVRHHSPACAEALRVLLVEVAPRQILIEAPADFEPLVPVLVDAATRPPVAIVALEVEKKRPRSEDAADDAPVKPRGVSYFPFCRHSPEYVSIRAATETGARLAFIDLPSGARLGRADVARTPQLAFADERVMSHSGYIAALCRQTGCRDHNELWDHMFEQRLGTADWRAFLGDVAAYGAHIRATVPADDLEADGTLAREAFMAAALREALARPERPIVVVTGAMHTPALAAALGAGAEPARANVPVRRRTREAATAVASEAAPAIETRAYLIRYGFRELDRLNGYAAGMPSPGWYDRVWLKLTSHSSGSPWQAAATDLVTQFRRRLAADSSGLEPSMPSVANALEQAARLADLRGHAGPARQDLIDACTSAFVKGEVVPGIEPVLVELARLMTGDALGDVPPSAGSPPLVETVRENARRLGFDLGSAARRKRELDIYRNDRHLAASRFLHAMSFLETGFANRISGPDVLGGHARDILFETWTVSWSPMVEARLIELSVDGDTIETVAARRLVGELRKLEAQGQGRNAQAGVRLLLTACLIGLQSRASAIVGLISSEIEADADLASVAKALSELFLVWRARSVLGLTASHEVEALLAAAYRRALYLLDGIGDTSEDRLRTVLGALATLREVVTSAEVQASAAGGEADDEEKRRVIDPAPFAETIVRLLDGPMPSLLAGATAALAYLSGHRDAAYLVARIRGSLAGAYVDVGERVAALNGMLAVTRELLWRVPQLLEEIDETITSLDEERFLAALPHLRLGFSALDPRETDEVASRIGTRRGARPDELAADVVYGIGEAEVAANAALAATMASELAEDGLGHWLQGAGSGGAA